jgi:hypothetical protein
VRGSRGGRQNEALGISRPQPFFMSFFLSCAVFLESPPPAGRLTNG